MILPACTGTEFGKHPNNAWMFKGIFRNHPVLPRYMVSYELDLVLNLLKWITLQTVTSLALLSGSYGH